MFLQILFNMILLWYYLKIATSRLFNTWSGFALDPELHHVLTSNLDSLGMFNFTVLSGQV